MHPVHTFPPYFHKIRSNIILAFTPRSFEWSLTLMLSDQNFICISSMLATCPTHHILLDLMTLIILGQAYKSWRLSLCNVLQPLSISSFLGPNICLSSLFLNILSLCSSLSLRDQVSHPYKTIGKITVFCILTCMFLKRRREGKKLWREMWQIFHRFNLLLISLWMVLWFVIVVPSYLKFATFS
jgi:hypothetical protein